MKDRVWNRLPLLWRAFGYFLYRYLFRLGFLDGREGLIFHTLQGFWFRFLIDSKIIEKQGASTGALYGDLGPAPQAPAQIAPRPKN